MLDICERYIKNFLRSMKDEASFKYGLVLDALERFGFEKYSPLEIGTAAS